MTQCDMSMQLGPGLSANTTKFKAWRKCAF
jgi:hypothetical protein